MTELQAYRRFDRLSADDRAVAAARVGEHDLAVVDGDAGVPSRDGAIGRQRGLRDVLVSADRDVPFERPSLSVERSVHRFDDIHGKSRFAPPETNSLGWLLAVLGGVYLPLADIFFERSGAKSPNLILAPSRWC